MKLKNLLLATLLVAFAFVSCKNENENVPDRDGREVQILSVIGSLTQPMATGAQWTANDRIGVFMKANGSTLSAGNIVDGAENVAYVTESGDGTFSSVVPDKAIKMPSDGRKVDFIAYYPYTSTITNYVYTVNVENQTSQEAIDLLYSNQATGKDKSNANVTLNFKHRLTKLVFNVKAGASVASLSGMTSKASGFKTNATFSLADGSLNLDNASIKNIVLKNNANGADIIVEGIIIPDSNINGAVVSFTIPNVGVYNLELADNTEFEGGKRYTYNIELRGDGSIVYLKTGATIEDWNSGIMQIIYPEKDKDIDTIPPPIWFETPAITPIPNTVYTWHFLPADAANPSRSSHRNYAMLYDTKYRLAYWVAYPMHAFYLGSTTRTDAWAYDPKIDEIYQPYLFSAFGITNIDRGHQIASADRTYSVAENRTTFYFTNMTAQFNTLNQQTWANLEMQIRTWTRECDTLYVVTGAMITSSTDSNIDIVVDRGGREVAKPKYYYKALAKKEGDMYYTIAFKMNNVATTDSYNNYRLTVAALEEETGFTFFPTIPAGTKQTINADKWK